jgi:hypothetical protein
MDIVRLSSTMDGAEDTLRRWMAGEAATAFAHDDVIAQLGLLRDQLLSGRSRWSPSVRSLRGTSTEMIPLVGWTWGKMQQPDAAGGRLAPERQSAADAIGYAMRTIRSSRRLIDAGSGASASLHPLEAGVVGEPQQALLSSSSLSENARVDLHPGVARSSLEAFQRARRVLEAVSSGSSVAPAGPSSVAWMSREYATSSTYAELAAYAAIATGSVVGLYFLGAFRSKKEEEPPPSFGDEEEDQVVVRQKKAPPEPKRSSLPLPKNPYGDPISRPGLVPTPFS